MKADAQSIARRPVISALGVICAAQFVLQLDFSIVNVALPTIQRELGFVPADLQWVVTGYALTFGSLLAVALGSLVGLYVGSVIAGIGYTPAFSAVFRSLVPLAPPDKRAELIESIYVVAYLAFSIPSFIAGVAVTHYSLRETTYVYGLVVMALSAITAVVLWRRRASRRASRRAAVGAGC